jgi:hypothetical protein
MLKHPAITGDGSEEELRIFEEPELLNSGPSKRLPPVRRALKIFLVSSL